MSWFWMNIPLGAVFFMATAGIPLWMVLRHSDTRSPAASPSATVPDATPLSQPVVVPVASGPRMRRELVGASSVGRA